MRLDYDAPHPVVTEITIATATFESRESHIPSTLYGQKVRVKVLTHDPEGDPRSTTVWIGGKQFPLSEIEAILDTVKRHQAAVAAWNDTKG